MCLLSVVLIGILRARTDRLVPGHPAFDRPADHHIYAYMATHPPGALHLAPWGWRVLAPGLVEASGLPTALGFQVVTFASLASTATLMYVIARRMSVRQRFAIFAPVLFATLGFAAKFNLYDFWLTDPAAFFFLAAAAACIAARKDLAFAVVLALGVVAKESVLFAAVLYYGLRAEHPLDRKVATRTLVLSLPAIAAVVGVRLSIPAWNGRPEYVETLPLPIRRNARTVPTYAPLSVVATTVAARSLVATLLAVLSSFGVIVGGLAVLGAWADRRLALRLSPFLLLVLSQLLFAQNTQRLVALGFPAVILLALTGVRWLEDEGHVARGVAIALVTGAFALQLADSSRWEPHAVLPLGLLAALALFEWARRRREDEAAPEG